MQLHLFAAYIDHFHRDAAGFCSRTLHEKGVTVGLLYFILYVCRNPGCTPIQMSADLELDRAYVLRCIQKLVDEGFFERRPHPTDGRATILFATEKGQDVCNTGKELLQRWDDRMLAGMSECEKQELFRLLNKIQRKGR